MNKLKKLSEEMEKKFNDLVDLIKNKFMNKIIIILFGSRAKNYSHLMSDYDILIIYDNENSEIKKIIPELDFNKLRKLAYSNSTDLFIYDINMISELLEQKNTIILDAFYEGKLIFDGLNLYSKLKDQVSNFLIKNNLYKTDFGWKIN